MNFLSFPICSIILIAQTHLVCQPLFFLLTSAAVVRVLEKTQDLGGSSAKWEPWYSR